MMAKAVHEIDPSADTILVLKNPGAPFAVWNDDWSPKTIKKKRKKERQVIINWDEPPLASNPVEGSSIGRESLFGGGQPGISEASSSAHFDLKAPQFEKPDNPPVLVEKEESSVHYRVSSRHLALGSEFFKISLRRNGWMEGQLDVADGMYHLAAADWDAEAFLILLQVLHLRNLLVPRSLTLGMLARIAVLVDYYRCSEAVVMFSEIWINTAKQTSPIPSTYGRDLILWMCIAWVFKLPAEFQQTTEIAFRQSKTRTIQDMCLPIPKLVLGRLSRARFSNPSC
jgi:hypothetical protein